MTNSTSDSCNNLLKRFLETSTMQWIIKKYFINIFPFDIFSGFCGIQLERGKNKATNLLETML